MAIKPVNELEYTAGVVASIVLLLAIVGFWMVFQQTPLDVTVDPPSEVIFPPLFAVVRVIEVIEVVLRVGKVARVVKLISLP